jgi:hypothetical protein
MAAVASEEGTTRFNGKHILVTWSRSTIDGKEEFLQKLLAVLPVGVRVFGGRELDAQGTPIYHAVISFVKKMHWPDAAKKFSIDGQTKGIGFAKPKPRHRAGDFWESSVAYCARDGDTFGERLSLEGAVAEQKKRKWQDIIDETDEEKVAINVKMGIRILETVSLSLLSFVG